MPQQDPARINISGIPVAGVGGLGLVAIAVLITMVMPAAWWLMVAGLVGGVVIGAALVAARHGLSTRGPSGSDPTILFRSLPADRLRQSDGESGDAPASGERGTQTSSPSRTSSDTQLAPAHSIR